MSHHHSRVTFHHVIGKAAVKGRCYHGLSITRSVQDNQFCAVNPRFIAMVTECTGGGAFIVISVRQTGRVSPLQTRVCGHSAPVLDIKWDPFNDLRLASCSEDCTVKVWDIPPNGLKDDLVEPSKDLNAHSRRVSIIEWHPTAKDLLLSSAYDCRVLVWRLDSAEVPVCVINTHSELVLCLSFNADGSLLATACKDKKIRIIEPRTGRVLQESRCHSHKVSRILFLWDLKMLVSTGSSCWNQRQFVLWDVEDLSEPLLEEDLDGGSGVIFPFYDADTHMLYLAGKGDGNIRYYTVSAVKPYAHLLSEYHSASPQRGLGVMPKRGLNTSACEIFRFYRLVAVRDLLEPLSFCVPRKSEGFHEDIYPLTAANEPAMTADEWLMGQNKGPLLMSLRPAAKALHTCPIESEAPANQDAEPAPDIIADLRDWTEDDTQSHDWTSSRFSPSCSEASALVSVRCLLRGQRSCRSACDQQEENPAAGACF
ncbi:coronin-2B isoform X2 [Sinocyclocheilus grahami]|uniref:coronin-2B isoform X2 n=1 Tax=Sinocyclocheilus grahami TaxID=75366 RepID=UPI0007ACD6AF|nr:PREDICTED: coronin-2B-like isoform X2 [Sinocyclocheilus grahami]